MLPRILTIAGSDCSGGAGIQADLKTFTALGTYGESVITALTAQNTLGVQSIEPVSPIFVAAQLESVLSDVGADAAKTGMLFSRDIIIAIAKALIRYRVNNLVVDPVMVSKSGHRLLKEDAVSALRQHILPLAAVATPNIPEASLLADMAILTMKDMRTAAEKICALGARSVIVKGGHMQGDHSSDIWFDGTNMIVFSTPRYAARHTHGTGCTFSAAIAAYLGKGLAPIEAIRSAKNFVSEAIRTAWPLGRGTGPVNHLWRFAEESDSGGSPGKP